MSVCRRLLEDRVSESEAFDDCLRAEVEVLVHDVGKVLSFVVKGFHHHRFHTADGVGNRHKRLLRVAVCDQVLCDEAAHVGCRTVHLRGVLAGECASAVGHQASVRVHHDFASGESSVRLKTSLYEASSRVHEDFNTCEVSKHCREEVLREVGAYLLEFRFFRMLG